MGTVLCVERSKVETPPAINCARDAGKTAEGNGVLPQFAANILNDNEHGWLYGAPALSA
ncbi:MAG: hypothetical protein WA733_07545 [Methylocystis sp.]